MTVRITANNLGELEIFDDETRFITSEGSVSGPRGVEFIGGFAGEVIVAGSAIGDSAGIDLNGDDRVIVTQTGAVMGLDTSFGDGIRAFGSNNTVSNAGYVYGTDFGISAGFNADGFEVENTASGVIEGGSNGAGADDGDSSAAIGAESSATIVNAGTILADVNGTTGLRVAIINGFEASTNAVMTVLNSGFIRGDMLFAAGNDLYDGRGGVVVGTIDGGADNDTLIGGVSLDLMIGGAGADFLNGNGGDDDLRGAGGPDTIGGGAGDDLIFGGNGNDLVMAGADNDTVDAGLDDDTVKGHRGEDSLLGSDGNDEIDGGDGDDVLRGQNGMDDLFGGRGNDTLFGGAEADTLNGGAGDDELNGGFGAEIYVFRGNFGADVITGFVDNNAEKIDLSGVARIVDFADLQANHLTASGGNAVIDAGGGNTITLTAFAPGDLDAGDFIF